MPAKWLLLAFVFVLPLMKPAVRYPVILADLVFVAVAMAWIASLIARPKFRWNAAYWAIAAYLAGVAPSLAVSAQPGLSAFKLSTMAYLAACAVIVDNLTDDERDLRWLFTAWLAATALVCAISLAALLSFPFAPDNPLLRYASFHSGTLPPGDYPRLSSTFFNANMLCNYLTVSLGMAVIAGCLGWISRRACAVLLAAIGVAAAASISPGLGGIALAAGLWIWLLLGRQAPRLAAAGLTFGIAGASLFLVALAVTPILHPTAPFLIQVDALGLTLAPSGRFLTWAAAWREFLANPLLGHGIGIHAVEVQYLSPAGRLQTLSDAHNMFLNIAAQAGVMGLAGLLVLIGYVAVRTVPLRLAPDRSNLLRLGLGITFLNAFVYQGLGGSFEDSRHLWVLLGLFLAAFRIERQRARSGASA